MYFSTSSSVKPIPLSSIDNKESVIDTITGCSIGSFPDATTASTALFVSSTIVALMGSEYKPLVKRYCNLFIQFRDCVICAYSLRDSVFCYIKCWQ